MKTLFSLFSPFVLSCSLLCRQFVSTMGSAVSSDAKLCSGRPLGRRIFHSTHRLKSGKRQHGSNKKRDASVEIRRRSSVPMFPNGQGEGNDNQNEGRAGSPSTAAAVRAANAPELTDKQKALVMETWVLVEEHIAEVKRIEME